MAYPESWLNELIGKKRHRLRRLLGYVDLKPKGRRLWGLCPVHGEKTASFSVSPDRQLYYCFGCHIGGSVIQFIMDVERLTFPEAVEFLANRVGMTMPEEVGRCEQMLRVRAKRERLSEACKLAARFYMETLLGDLGGPGRAYLKRRGITSDSVRSFGLGYAPRGVGSAQELSSAKKATRRKSWWKRACLSKTRRPGSTYDAYRGQADLSDSLGQQPRDRLWRARAQQRGESPNTSTPAIHCSTTSATTSTA